MAVANRDLGRVQLARGRLEEAEVLVRRALEIDNSRGHKEGIAADFSELGKIFAQKSDFVQAENAHRDAIALFHGLGLLARENTEVGALAAVHQQCGELEKSERLIKVALSENEQTGRLQDLASNYRLLALIARSKDESVEAASYLTKSLRLYLQVGLLNDARGVQDLLVSFQAVS